MSQDDPSSEGRKRAFLERGCSALLPIFEGGNELAGMVICEQAAKALREDFIQLPWN